MVKGIALLLGACTLALLFSQTDGTSIEDWCRVWDQYLQFLNSSQTVKRTPIDSEVPMRWKNPCGVQDDANPEDDFVPGRLSKDEWMTLIKMLEAILQKAKENFDSFRETHLKEVSTSKGCDSESKWENVTYAWLPKVPKGLDTPTDSTQLKNLKFEWFVVRGYRWLQEVDVGLEQIVNDLKFEKQNGSYGFQTLFKDVWQTNNNVLCYVWDIMMNIEAKPIDNASRDIMDDKLRNIKPIEERRFRDWIIFRTYMILTEFLLECTTHFLQHKDEIPVVDLLNSANVRCSFGGLITFVIVISLLFKL